ncbi:MAG TPA: hypothetical protein PLD58_24740 [Phycisphaerae bacterium]|nr:hypothetical protein [Phycisphaerae bacterium]
MTVHDVIRRAEALLPGRPAPEEQEKDPRWQAIIEIGKYVESDCDAVWAFAARWGSQGDEDLRAAVATCLLEHLLEYHFDRFFPLVRNLAGSDPRFAATFLLCGKFGRAESGDNSRRFDELRVELGASPLSAPAH